MAVDTILQGPIFTKFIWPFLLIFFVVFAILEKTKVLGDDKKQVNAFISLVIGMIFVGAVYPVDVVSNLILFLTVALVVLLVFLMLYGFVAGDPDKLKFAEQGWLKWAFMGLVFVAVVVAVFWATGSSSELYNFFFDQSWSEAFWTNAAFLIVIVVALVVVLRKSS